MASGIFNPETNLLSQQGGYDWDVNPAIETWRDQYFGGQATALRDKMYSMMMDPNLRGYDPATKNMLFGRQADALTGSKMSTLKSNDRMLAAQGYGHTGHMMRSRMGLDQQYAPQMREAARDTELADADLKDQNLWKSISDWTGTADLGRQYIDMKQRLQDAKTGVANTFASYKTANRGKSFLGKIGGSFAENFGKTLAGQ